MSFRGDMGERGRDGATGAEGRAGTTGITGTSGAEGRAGATGATGPRGKSGRNAAAAFLILMTFSFMGFVRVDGQTEKIEDLATDSVTAAREGCERLNIVRENQAATVGEQIRYFEAVLEANVIAIRELSSQIRRSNRIRRQALTRLQESVNDNPVPGKPYNTDCVAAFP